MWHASVCMWDGGPIAVDALPRPLRRIGAELARELIAGVGTGPVIEHRKQLAQHARRSLRDAEIAGLDPAWVAIPAIDMG